MQTRPAYINLALAFAACDGDGSARPDAGGVVVSGCDDPAVWTLPALAAAEPEFDVGGDRCGPAQLPLHRVWGGWHTEGSIESINRVCWRVTEASPGSGWTAGQAFSSDMLPSISIIGFSRPITVEGRALLADGTIAYAIAPKQIELAPAMVVEPEASSVIAVMGRDAWAETNAVHLWAQHIPTDEVLDAASIRREDGVDSDPITLHRVGANVVRRKWTHQNNQVEYTDVVIGPGTRGRITKSGNTVLLDGTELAILGHPAGSGELVVTYRVTLPAEPLEIIETASSVLMHLPGTLMGVDATETLAVGDGVLVPASDNSPPYFFDGATFRTIRWEFQQIVLDPSGFTPPAEDLARLGKPVGVIHNVVIGENGLLASDRLLPANTMEVGPPSVSYADVFGDGHLGPLSLDTATYVIEHDSGGAELYQAPYYGQCVPL